MYNGARLARTSYDVARALSSQLEGASGEGIAEFKTAVDALAPAPRAGGGGRGGGGSVHRRAPGADVAPAPR